MSKKKIVESEMVTRKFNRFRFFGKPTCCSHWPDQVCKFLQTYRFGTCEVCAMHGGNEQLRRRQGVLKDSIGALIPDPNVCVIWTKKELEGKP